MPPLASHLGFASSSILANQTTTAAYLASALLAAVLACNPPEKVRAVDDIDFVSADADTSETSDITEGSGCSMLRPDDCSGRACCDSGQRCIPAAAGGTLCTDAGDRQIGERCGELGVDDCQLGTFCVQTSTHDRDRICRLACDPRANECGTNQCLSLGVSSQLAGVCVEN